MNPTAIVLATFFGTTIALAHAQETSTADRTGATRASAPDCEAVSESACEKVSEGREAAIDRARDALARFEAAAGEGRAQSDTECDQEHAKKTCADHEAAKQLLERLHTQVRTQHEHAKELGERARAAALRQVTEHGRAIDAEHLAQQSLEAARRAIENAHESVESKLYPVQDERYVRELERRVKQLEDELAERHGAKEGRWQRDDKDSGGEHRRDEKRRVKVFGVHPEGKRFELGGGKGHVLITTDGHGKTELECESIDFSEADGRAVLFGSPVKVRTDGGNGEFEILLHGEDGDASKIRLRTKMIDGKDGKRILLSTGEGAGELFELEIPHIEIPHVDFSGLKIPKVEIRAPRMKLRAHGQSATEIVEDGHVIHMSGVGVHPDGTDAVEVIDLDGVDLDGHGSAVIRVETGGEGGSRVYTYSVGSNGRVHEDHEDHEDAHGKHEVKDFTVVHPRQDRDELREMMHSMRSEMQALRESLRKLRSEIEALEDSKIR